MLCWNCGKETSNLSKICDACAEAGAKAPQHRARMLPVRDEMESRRRFPFGQLALATLVCLAAYFLSTHFLREKPLIFEHDSRTLRVAREDGSAHVRYTVRAVKNFAGRVVDLSPAHLKVEGGGIAGVIIMMSEADYRTLQKDYVATGKCPASFINSHSSALALVPGEAAQAAALMALKLNRGDTFELIADELAFNEGSYEGRPFQFNLGANMQAVRPRSLEINDVQVF